MRSVSKARHLPAHMIKLIDHPRSIDIDHNEYSQSFLNSRHTATSNISKSLLRHNCFALKSDIKAVCHESAMHFY